MKTATGNIERDQTLLIAGEMVLLIVTEITIEINKEEDQDREKDNSKLLLREGQERIMI